MYIVRYGEIGLKGLNRRFFEHALVRNIKKHVPGLIIRKRNRIYVHSDQDKDTVISALTKTCGVVSVSSAEQCDCTLDAISRVALMCVKEELRKREINTFRISTQRLEKKIDTSIHINEQVGSAVIDAFHFRVQLEDPDLDIGIEIHDHAYVYAEKIAGPGGLPVGVEGTVASLMSDDNALFSTYVMLKRGCRVIQIVFDPAQVVPATAVCKKLEPFSPFPLTVHCIKEDELEDFLFRRHAVALVTPEELPAIKESLIRPTFRPLIAFPAFMKEKIAGHVGQ